MKSSPKKSKKPVAKLKNPNMNRLIIMLAIVVSFAAVGTYLLIRSHADSTQVSCYPSGNHYITKAGATTIDQGMEYNCGWIQTQSGDGAQSGDGVPVYGRSNNRVGYFSTGSSTHWILCQSVAATYHRGQYYNDWWAYTANTRTGAAGWVNATYALTGVNNGNFHGVPACSGKGMPPTLTYYPPQSWLFGAGTGERAYTPGNFTLAYNTTTLTFQTDGNLVLYQGSTPIWASNTNGNYSASLKLFGYGKISIYPSSSATSPIWTMPDSAVTVSNFPFGTGDFKIQIGNGSASETFTGINLGKTSTGGPYSYWGWFLP